MKAYLENTPTQANPSQPKPFSIDPSIALDFADSIAATETFPSLPWKPLLNYHALGARITKNPDLSTGPLARPFAHSLARGTVNDWKAISYTLVHSAMKTFNLWS